MKLKNTALLLFASAALLSIVIPAWIETAVYDKKIYPGTESVSFAVPRGASLSKIAEILRSNGFDITDFELKITSKLTGKDGMLRHGRFNYDPSSDMNMKDFVNFLTTGGHMTLNVTFPEGSRITEIAGILQKSMNIDSTAFVERTTDSLLLSRYGIKAVSMEGYLYPETYNFNESATIDEIIDRMYRTFRNRTDIFKKAVEINPYSEHELITLASIIQGEVMVYDEIYHISAVYNNRLKKNMLLQADPTVQYLFERPKRLLNADIAIDSPYNTYIYRGLPPGPVNNPSSRALKAALEPADVPYIFMVAKGDGRHYFNTDYESHLRDKAKFDTIRRNLKRK